ncbi:GerMN domain-containing protein [Virgibacillus alimentarius]|uniref:GerMN domain-containing protein n=1 Tax=Virgibacillus alimentarius TaxID=698769 RepID=UPI000493A7AB|nr:MULTISPECIES: GerMN domain-containing protein [Virgibacillus]HLR67132.1 GerMN domain-containing protein [Virgibacillus sp.]
MKKYGVLTLMLMMILSIILTGCFQGEQSMKEIDVPQNNESAEKEDATDKKSESKETKEGEKGQDSDSEKVARQLYLVDANGMVVSQTLELPKEESKEVATQALEYLVKDGPVTSILPNGFQAVLPAGTEILGLNLQEDGTMIVDVSKEFENYEADEELNILEAMTFTITQFDDVDKMKLRINGHSVEEMPVNGTPIKEGYTRANGINLKESDALDLLKSEAVTMYYPAEHNENRYYVPVTQHLEYDDQDIFSSIVQTLIDGPRFNINATHVFNSKTKLTNKPVLNEDVLELSFSKDILKDGDKAMISDEVMETLVRTLTDQEEVEGVKVEVEGVDKLVNENGEAYTEPVTKKTFVPTDKL